MGRAGGTISWGQVGPVRRVSHAGKPNRFVAACKVLHRQQWTRGVVVVIGGGRVATEAALVAAQKVARVVLIERDGVGGAAVLTDCVPSKTLVATAQLSKPSPLKCPSRVRIDGAAINPQRADLQYGFDRIKRLAAAQSNDITQRLITDGVEVRHVRIHRRPGTVEIVGRSGVLSSTVDYDICCSRHRRPPAELPDAIPDGQRILANWKQVWGLWNFPNIWS